MHVCWLVLPQARVDVDLRVERVVIRIDLCQVNVEVGALGLWLQLIVQLFKHFLVVRLRLRLHYLLESNLLICILLITLSDLLLLLLFNLIKSSRLLIILNQQVVRLAHIRMVTALLRYCASVAIGNRLRYYLLLLVKIDCRALTHLLLVVALRWWQVTVGVPGRHLLAVLQLLSVQ